MKFKTFEEWNKIYEAEGEIDFTLEEEPKKEEPAPAPATPKVDTAAAEASEEAADDADKTDSNTDDKYEKVKADLRKMLTDSGNEKDILKRVNDESVEALNIKGFNQDSDVYDFYLAHQFELDEKLNEENFFDSKMSELGISGLYNAVIVGTQFAVKKLLQEMK